MRIKSRLWLLACAVPVFLQAAPAGKVELSSLDAPTEKGSGPLPNPASPADRIGFAVVGLGHLSLAQILPAFAQAKHAKLAALVSGDRAKGFTVARQYGLPESHVYTYEQFDQLKNDKDVQVVYIVLPNSMHKDYTIRAAQAGKDVLCEKPMATTVKDAEEMVAACKKADRKLMIAYRMQYEPHQRAAIALTRSQKFGALKAMDCENAQNVGDPSQWRLKKSLSGGGPLPDVGIYCINAARYISGEEPIEVFAMQKDSPGDPRFQQVEEQMNFMMRFPSGFMMNGMTGYSVHETRRYRLDFPQGWIEMNPAFPYKGVAMKVGYDRPKDEVSIVEEQHMEPKDQFALEMDHMAQCVITNKLPRTPGEEGLQDQRIIEALYQSAKEGKPVKLPAVAGKDPFRHLD